MLQLNDKKIGMNVLILFQSICQKAEYVFGCSDVEEKFRNEILGRVCGGEVHSDRVFCHLKIDFCDHYLDYYF